MFFPIKHRSLIRQQAQARDKYENSSPVPIDNLVIEIRKEIRIIYAGFAQLDDLFKEMGTPQLLDKDHVLEQKDVDSTAFVHQAP